MAKTKALISFAVIAKLICAFVFAYEYCWFSNAAAHLQFLFENGKKIQIAYFVDKTGSWEIGSGLSVS